MQLGNHRWSHVWVMWILHGFAHWQPRRSPLSSFADYGIKSLCGGMARDGPLKFHEQYMNESATSDYSYKHVIQINKSNFVPAVSSLWVTKSSVT